MLLLIPPVLLFWLAGVLATINEFRQFAVIALVIVAILTMVGPRAFRIVIFPSLYLFFLVPFGQYLIPPMQLIATWFTDHGLSLLGIVHYTEGTIIELPTGRFEIAEACAGLRFVIATVALGTLFAHFAYRQWWKSVIFLAACVAVPLVANGLRCTGTIALAYFTNDAAAVEADHIVYGWGFNVAILLGMLFLGMRFRDSPVEPKRREIPEVYPERSSAVLTAFAATALLILTVPAVGYWRDSDPADADATSIKAPSDPPGWTTVPPSGFWRPTYDAPDQEIDIGLLPNSASAHSVDVAILYYARIRPKHSLISSTNHLWDVNRWYWVRSGDAAARFGITPVQFSEDIISAGSDQRIVWSTYWVNGRFTNNPLAVKILQLSAVLFGRESAALVAISTPIDGPIDDARTKLAAAAAALSELPQQLNATGRSGSSD